MLLALAFLAGMSQSALKAQEVVAYQHDARVGSDICVKSPSMELCRDAYVIAKMSARHVRTCRFTVKSSFRDSYAGDPRFEDDFKAQCSAVIDLCEVAHRHSFAARSDSGKIRNKQGVDEAIRQACRWESS